MNTLLLHRIAVADGYGIVFHRLVIHDDTERRPDQVLAGVTAYRMAALLS